MTRPLFIAGIGNLFFGDDAFGCEVVRRLARCYARLPEGVELRDFGVAVRALGYALAARPASAGAGLTLIVDAVATGAAPGTLQLFDLGRSELRGSGVMSPHAGDLDDALAAAIALGGRLDEVYLLGCEPASLEPAFEDAATASDSRAVTGGCPLSDVAEAAAQRCVSLLRRLIDEPDLDLRALCGDSSLREDARPARAGSSRT